MLLLNLYLKWALITSGGLLSFESWWCIIDGLLGLGQVTKKVLELVPNTNINALERCSGHDGTYGVRKETHTYSVKIGMPVAKKINDTTDLVVSDCVMAGNHVAHIASQDIESIHPISLVKLAYGL